VLDGAHCNHTMQYGGVCGRANAHMNSDELSISIAQWSVCVMIAAFQE
jgi:hypothetical protein